MFPVEDHEQTFQEEFMSGDLPSEDEEEDDFDLLKEIESWF